MSHVVSSGSKSSHRKRFDGTQTAPTPLQAEVKFIQNDFLCDGIAAPPDFRSTGREQCFKELRNLQHGLTEPAVFEKYFKSCVETICEAVPTTFLRFLSIAPIKNDVDWATKQMNGLLEIEEVGAENWIKSACDPFDQPPLQTSDNPLEWLSRPNWRAPAFLLSVLNPGNPYDPLTAWDRLDQATSDSVLRGLRDYHWMSPLERSLAHIVGLTGEHFARERSSNAATQATLSSNAIDNREIKPQIWRGTARELADKILGEWEQGKIEAKTKTEALRKGTANIIRSDGSRFGERSMIQNLNNRKDYETPDGQKRTSSPAKTTSSKLTQR